MKQTSEIGLRRWAIQIVIANACLETWPDVVIACRLAAELIEYVKSGQQPMRSPPHGRLN